jgi:hypothetical protein
MHICTNDKIPNILGLTGPSTAFEDSVREFVDEHILKNASGDKRKELFETYEGKLLTLLQASMMMLGCYGNVYEKGNLHALLKQDTIWTNYTTAFLLQALQNNAGPAPTRVHDRSACTCMKDFASPTTLLLNDDQNFLDIKTTDR